MSKKQIDLKTGKITTLAQFDALAGESTAKGGNSLNLDEGQAAGPFVYVGTREIEIDGDPVTVHDAKVAPDGETVGMPLAASFNHQIEDLGVKKGDTFFVARAPDAAKKKGKGKGRMMRIFRLKVTARAK